MCSLVCRDGTTRPKPIYTVNMKAIICRWYSEYGIIHLYRSAVDTVNVDSYVLNIVNMEYLNHNYNVTFESFSVSKLESSGTHTVNMDSFPIHTTMNMETSVVHWTLNLLKPTIWTWTHWRFTLKSSEGHTVNMESSEFHTLNMDSSAVHSVNIVSSAKLYLNT